MKKIIFKLISLILIGMCLLGNIALSTVFAEEETFEILDQSKDSIVCIEAVCWDGEKNYEKRSYSGFVVSSESNGLYVVTVKDGLTYSTEEKEEIKKTNHLEENAKVDDKIEVVFQGDLRIAANIVGESAQRNLVVLKLEQNVKFSYIPEFEKEDAEITDNIYLMGFPSFPEDVTDHYNQENVQVLSGVILNEYRSEDIKFQTHSIQSEESTIGGPLFNSNGYIIGMVQSPWTEQGEGICITANEIKEFLTTFQVEYSEYEEDTATQKKPILNIILGAVILFLFQRLLVKHFKFRRMLKGSSGRSDLEKSSKKNSVRSKNKKSRKDTEEQNQNPNRSEQINARAALESAADGRKTPIDRKEFIIGRSGDADLVMDGNKGVSRQHARIKFDGIDYVITDLNSMNHTYVNGVEVRPGEYRRLSSGDEIMLGKEKLYFIYSE